VQGQIAYEDDQRPKNGRSGRRPIRRRRICFGRRPLPARWTVEPFQQFGSLMPPRNSSSAPMPVFVDVWYRRKRGERSCRQASERVEALLQAGSPTMIKRAALANHGTGWPRVEADSP
jgi:hypothetical protein